MATVFTTHATLLGRYLCAGNADFYNNLDKVRRSNLEEPEASLITETMKPLLTGLRVQFPFVRINPNKVPLSRTRIGPSGFI